jgi:hypothetical protein
VIEDVVRSAGKVTRSAAAASTTTTTTTAAAASTAAATATTTTTTTVTSNVTGVGLRPRRSTRQHNANQRAAVIVPEQPRKSPRGKRQAQQQRLSETHEDSIDEKKRPTDDDVVVAKGLESPALDKDVEDSSVKSPDSCTASGKGNICEKDEPEHPVGSEAAKANAEEDDGEPTTLIDPVTGLLIPMRESEEGQYIPVTTTPVIIPVSSAAQITTRSLSESQELPCTVVEPDRTRPRAHSVPTIPKESTRIPAQEGTPAVGVAQQSHVPVISNSLSNPVGTASVTTPPGPCVVGLRPVGTCKPGVQTTSSTKTVPTTLKAHVLQQTAKTTPSQLVNTASKVVQPISSPLPPTATSAAQPSVPSQSSAVKVQAIAQPSGKNQTVPVTAAVAAHSKTRDTLLHQAQSQLSPVVVTKSLQSAVPINPKAHLLQSVTGTKSPGGQTVVVAPGQGQVPMVSKIHHLSCPPPLQPQQMAVNIKVSSPGALTPKAHLLQAVSSGPPKTGSSVVPQQKSPHSAHMSVAGGKVPTSSPPQPPKAHHGPAQQPIMTGAVASPPLKAPQLSSQQPVVTGASSSRAAVPKSQVGCPSE